MISKSQLTGKQLKRNLGLHRARYEWNCKNKSGGYFGIGLIAEPTSTYKILLAGNYNVEGEIWSLLIIGGNRPRTECRGVQSLTCKKLLEMIRNRMGDKVC